MATVTGLADIAELADMNDEDARAFLGKLGYQREKTETEYGTIEMYSLMRDTVYNDDTHRRRKLSEADTLERTGGYPVHCVGRVGNLWCDFANGITETGQVAMAQYPQRTYDRKLTNPFLLFGQWDSGDQLFGHCENLYAFLDLVDIVDYGKQGERDDIGEIVTAIEKKNGAEMQCNPRLVRGNYNNLWEVVGNMDTLLEVTVYKAWPRGEYVYEWLGDLYVYTSDGGYAAGKDTEETRAKLCREVQQTFYPAVAKNS